MNLDETGIPMFMGDSVGNIQRLIASATSTEPGNKPPTQSATRSQLREIGRASCRERVFFDV
jgi:hypothetical protein